MIQKLASTSSVDVRESYMKPLEVFVRKHHEGLKVRGEGRKRGGSESERYYCKAMVLAIPILTN